jgi:hypothetical protein
VPTPLLMEEVSYSRGDSQLMHHTSDHRNKQVTWMRLIGQDDESVRDAEKLLYATNSGEGPENVFNEPPSDVVVWLCVHCMDLPSQQAPVELHEVIDHLKTV